MAVWLGAIAGALAGAGTRCWDGGVDVAFDAAAGDGFALAAVEF
jgi:hypothetical protein